MDVVIHLFFCIIEVQEYRIVLSPALDSYETGIVRYGLERV